MLTILMSTLPGSIELLSRRLPPTQGAAATVVGVHDLRMVAPWHSIGPTILVSDRAGPVIAPRSGRSALDGLEVV